MVERIITNKDYYKANLTSSGQIESNFHELNMGDEIKEERPHAKPHEITLDGPKGQTVSGSVKTLNSNGIQVKILTINMFMRPVINTNGSDHKEGRLKYFSEKYLGQYDIICF